MILAWDIPAFPDAVSFDKNELNYFLPWRIAQCRLREMSVSHMAATPLDGRTILPPLEHECPRQQAPLFNNVADSLALALLHHLSACSFRHCTGDVSCLWHTLRIINFVSVTLKNTARALAPRSSVIIFLMRRVCQSVVSVFCLRALSFYFYLLILPHAFLYTRSRNKTHIVRARTCVSESEFSATFPHNNKSGK